MLKVSREWIKKNKSSVITTIVVAGLMLSILLVFEYLDFGISNQQSEITDKSILIAGAVVMIFLSLAVHELGHLITGLVQGFKFHLYVVGFLGIKRDDNDRIKVYLNTDFNYFGGIAATLPIGKHPDNVKKFANLVIAGPLASLLFAMLCGLLSFLSTSLWHSFWQVGSLISLMTFLATTLPGKTGVFFSDRKRYQRLRSVGKDREVEMALMNIIGIQSRDDSLKNIDLTDVEIVKLDETPFLRFIGEYYEMLYLLEVHPDLEEDHIAKFNLISQDLPTSMVKLFKKDLESELLKSKQSH